MQPRGMRGSETNLPNLPQHLPAQPRLSLKGHGMDPPNTAPPQPQASVPVHKQPTELVPFWGTPDCWGTYCRGTPSPILLLCA